MPGTHSITAVQRHSGRSAHAPFLVNTNWPQFHYSAAHTGFNPYENVLSASNVAGLGVDWSFPAACTDPAVANGVVYLGCSTNKGAGDAYALNAGTGARLWHVHSVRGFSLSPAVANGVVYVGTTGITATVTGTLYALNATTGTKIWSLATGDFGPTGMAVAHGVVYLGSFGGHVYALNASTGAKLWSRVINDAFDGLAEANGVVYLGSNDGNLYALNAATGTKLWTFTTGSDVFVSPAVADGVVYIGSYDTVYAFHLPGGAAAIKRPTPG